MEVDELHAIRRVRLAEIVNSDRFGGSQTAFAEAVGQQQNYISRQLAGAKNVGETLARRYEKALGLPVGWFDQPGGSGVPELSTPSTMSPRSTDGPDYPDLIARRVATLDEALQLAVLNFIETFAAANREPRDDRSRERRRGRGGA